MIADYRTMPMMFSECNRKYFGHSLPTPKFGLMKKLNTLAEFTAVKDKKSKHGLKQMRVLFSPAIAPRESMMVHVLFSLSFMSLMIPSGSWVMFKGNFFKEFQSYHVNHRTHGSFYSELFSQKYITCNYKCFRTVQVQSAIG